MWWSWLVFTVILTISFGWKKADKDSFRKEPLSPADNSASLTALWRAYHFLHFHQEDVRVRQGPGPALGIFHVCFLFTILTGVISRKFCTHAFHILFCWWDSDYTLRLGDKMVARISSGMLRMATELVCRGNAGIVLGPRVVHISGPLADSRHSQA